MMREIAKHQNVYCKISGMITEADYKTWTPEQVHPYMKLVLNLLELVELCMVQIGQYVWLPATILW
ncbi:MAG: hypothetical protein CM15mP32_3270 [Flavobacteriaceae bacterium]|nr:MAG: hypothetical protein CM15mP32_3270 [Flavobacteriaceae bacterium]